MQTIIARTIFAMIMISGLVLAGSEAEPFLMQVICSTIGVVLFAVGGFLFAVSCEKNKL